MKKIELLKEELINRFTKTIHEADIETLFDLMYETGGGESSYLPPDDKAYEESYCFSCKKCKRQFGTCDGVPEEEGENALSICIKRCKQFYQEG